MLCSVCKQKLAESDSGRKVHMARYHNVLAEAKQTPTYKPMSTEEKTRIVNRMEARFSEGVIIYPCVKAVKAEVKPVMSWKEYNERLDALCAQSELMMKQIRNEFRG
jgi:hypothetical protein